MTGKRDLMKKGREVKCPHCKHKFISKSKLKWVSCNNCLGKFKMPEKEKQKEIKNGNRKKKSKRSSNL